MARRTNKTLLSSLLSSLLFMFFLISTSYANKYHKTLNPRTLGLRREKLSHLKFYFHDVVSGKSPTVVRVASASTTNTSATSFGFVAVMDDPLTLGPEMNSTRVGSAQGIYASASQTDLGLLMVHTYAFTAGKYNGSSLSILGRNAVFNAVRELPIVGGSGLFRFARGYALAKTHVFDIKSGDAVVEYNVYVLHY